jgi:hypothetical protein
MAASWVPEKETNMGNAAPTFKNQDHAFEIALTAVNYNDWTLCRQTQDHTPAFKT